MLVGACLKKKSLSAALLVAIIVSVILVSTVHFSTAQSGTNISGIISSNAVWTEANSPYELTGNVLVSNGVTLAIQPGTFVNLGSYFIEVNGTLQAVGNEANPVIFNNGQITFTKFSRDWNESTASGCIITNSIINSTLAISNAAEIDNDTIYSSVSTMYAITIQTTTGMPVISNNTIEGDLSNSLVEGDIIVASNANANISDNTIMNDLMGQNDVVTQGIDAGFSYYGNITISRNIIINCYAAIDISGQGFGTTLPIIEGNLIVNNTLGIYVNEFEENLGPIIQNNTITQNNIGIDVYAGTSSSMLNPTILNNNIFGNTNYNFKNQDPSNINATYNWWGTTNIPSINTTIYDYHSNFNFGKVSFVPFLKAPNPKDATYVLAISGDGGNVNPNGYVRVNYGSDQWFTITPFSGYHISRCYSELDICWRC